MHCILLCMIVIESNGIPDDSCHIQSIPNIQCLHCLSTRKAAEEKERRTLERKEKRKVRLQKLEEKKKQREENLKKKAVEKQKKADEKGKKGMG